MRTFNPWDVVIFIALLAIFAATMFLTSGCVDGAAKALPVFGYDDPRCHGRDIEKEQGIKREADGWITSDGARYRVKDGKLEWIVYVSNITDMPRRASCSIVGSFENYERLASVCLTAKDEGQTILPPNSAGEIKGSVAAPNNALRAFSRSTVLPMPAPRSAGPVVLRCVVCKDGIATLEWKATATAMQHELTVTYFDDRNNKYQTKKRLGATAYDITAVLYAQDQRTELARDSKRVDVDVDHKANAVGRIDLPMEKAADVGLITVQWQEVSSVEKP